METIDATIDQLVEDVKQRSFDTHETSQFLKYHQVILWSWGVEYFRHYESKGLLLKVNGRLHTGYVLITLDWMDTFEYRLINPSGEVVSVHEGIYIDMLIECLDKSIETPS